MALQESRQIFQTIIDCSVSGVSERGGILSYVPGVDGLVAARLRGDRVREDHELGRERARG